MNKSAMRRIRIPDHAALFPVLWNEIKPRNGERVLDIGMGSKATSASALASQGFEVVGMDIKPECGKFSKTLYIPVVACDAAAMPFKEKAFDYCAAVFSLHEMDPKHHGTIIREMGSISRIIIIIEPLLRKDGLGGEIDRLWFEAMRSAGKFEKYQSMRYWDALVRSLKVKSVRRILINIVGDITEKSPSDMCAMMDDYFRKEGASNRYIIELKRLGARLRNEGMPRSEVLLLIAELQL